MRAKGWFFSQAEVLSYVPVGSLFGQATVDSCVAACCRMILSDHGILIAESYLRDALTLDEGSYVSQIPSVLQEFGLQEHWAYRNDLVLADLIVALRQGTVTAFVKAHRAASGHALLIDEITDDLVSIRDPLPQGEGKAYRLGTDEFLNFWLRPKTNRGQAVVVLE